ncbi:helix-turn-helix domain-containing protein [Gulosibacter molinativorax]|uniref:Sigma-54 factor interaction domain-containing protein n=1 Tax=Gulosibacter molinativorax TaxID=256821 RepID=A0ABT7C747_9MICO|nr:helix-turn-helix domain-containing protein [Gulosibacter molinativorax]MDJ1370860.1 hypothetical protein [Gulosibacter molinativorax]
MLRSVREQLLTVGVEVASISDANLDPVIERSWRRTVSSGDVVPDAHPKFRLDDVRQSSPERLMKASGEVFSRWHSSLVGQPVSILLSDPAGRIIARQTEESSVLRRLDRAYASEGYDFSESSIGTNGLGTALEERNAILINGAEHFSDALSGLTCAGMSIRHPGTGRLLGSIALAAPERAAHPMMLAIVKQVASELESAIANQGIPEHIRAMLALFLGTSPTKTVLALSRDGVYSTTGGLSLLSAETHVKVWEHLQSLDWSSNSIQPVTIGYSTGTARRLYDAREDTVYGIELDNRTLVSGHSNNWHAQRIAELNEATDLSATIAVTGPNGVGKVHLTREWLSQRHGVTPTVVSHATDQDADRLQRELASGSSIILSEPELRFERAEGSELLNLFRHQNRPGRGHLIITTSDSAMPRMLEKRSGLRIPNIALQPLMGDVDRITEIVAEYGEREGLVLSAAATQALLRWNWPGNVRELTSLLTHLKRTHGGNVVDAEALPAEMRMRARSLYGLAASEYRSIEEALERTGGNRSRAAELLGIGRTTLYRKMREYGIGATQRLAE